LSCQIRPDFLTPRLSSRDYSNIPLSRRPYDGDVALVERTNGDESWFLLVRAGQFEDQTSVEEAPSVQKVDPVLVDVAEALVLIPLKLR
jgi:hypothetical protein